MYKSTAATVSNKSFIMENFTQASVSIDVQISGFATSYSYYAANEEIEGISAKDVNKANSVSNDWMGPGKAVCTITKSGIPSTLLSVKSVSLFVNGTEFSGVTYTVGSDNTITIDQTTGHTAWEQKNITVKVVYTTPDGATFESNTSNTLTRHITGLPYKNIIPSNSGTHEWSIKAGSQKIQFSSDGVILGSSGTATENPKVASPKFHSPSTIDITSLVDFVLTSHKVGITYHPEFYMYIADVKVITEKGNSTSGTNYSKSVTGTLTNENNTIEFSTDTRIRLSGNAKVKNISVLYR